VRDKNREREKPAACLCVGVSSWNESGQLEALCLTEKEGLWERGEKGEWKRGPSYCGMGRKGYSSVKESWDADTGNARDRGGGIYPLSGKGSYLCNLVNKSKKKRVNEQGKDSEILHRKKHGKGNFEKKRC